LRPAASAQRESFLAAKPFDALMIDRYSLAPQHAMQRRASPAAVHLRQRAQALPQQLLVAIRLRRMSKRASRDSDQPAGATLREMMACHYFRHHLSLHRGP